MCPNMTKSFILLDKLLLSDRPEDYEYLKYSRTTIDGVDDALEWRQLKVSLYNHHESTRN
jgi:myosin heavy subunit